jgi:hypothetical protein
MRFGHILRWGGRGGGWRVRGVGVRMGSCVGLELDSVL